MKKNQTKKWITASIYIYSFLAKRNLFAFSFRIAIILIPITLIIAQKKGDAQSQKPNVIFILGDDIGFYTPTVNGGTSYSTPNLDTLAKQGINFRHCHSTPLCSPSRVMLLTGKYNFRNYVRWGVLDQTQKTIGNMFKDAGYKTACFGKWQLSGGEQSIHTFGFDSYCVFDATGYTADNEESPLQGSRYKNPTIYVNGDYADSSQTANKYGEDIFTDSVLNFITRNKSMPFFIYYPMVLAHPPFQPTPDDPVFDTLTGQSDTSFYRSMIHYMDKKIGLILKKVKSLGIENKTVIMYVGDNGTPREIYQRTDHGIIQGGKGSPREYGTHVPLMVYWPGHIKSGTTNYDLIDFTDFLPTLADIAKIPLPTTYGPLDGVSFSPRLTGQPGIPRQWIFCYWDENRSDEFVQHIRRWAQTKTYKLYDTSYVNSSRLFYNIVTDIKEAHPIWANSITPEETVIKKQLLKVLNGYVAQGVPFLSNPTVSLITDSSAMIEDTIKINGGSTVTANGVVWSTGQNPTLSSGNHASGNTVMGPFVKALKGLKSNTTYFARGFAINRADTAYSNQVKFKTLLQAPFVLAATSVDSTHFIARWKAFAEATYRLDVSTSATFVISKPSRLTEGFNKGITPSKGWTINQYMGTNDTVFATTAPALEFKRSEQEIITPILRGTATQLRFWIEGLGKDGSSLLVEGFDGIHWLRIENITNLPKTATIKTYNSSSTPSLGKNFIQFKFIFTRFGGPLVIDDIFINYNAIIPSFVPGYHNLTVNDTFQKVSGLKPGTRYYYRVRTKSSTNISVNSKVISVFTLKAALLNIAVSNINCHGRNDGVIVLTVVGDTSGLTLNWTGPDGFTSSNKAISSLKPGIYDVTVKTNGSYPVNASAKITEPDIDTCLTQGSAKATSLGNVSDRKFKGDNVWKVDIFPNPSATEFNLIAISNSDEKVEIIVMDINGKKVYEVVGNSNETYRFGNRFSAGMYIVTVTQSSHTQKLKLIKR
jgi:arylsulfatase A